MCALASAALMVPLDGSAQIARHPTGVNVNAMGATTVFLTFGNLSGMIPVEALWCGALVPASPDVGNRCDPATIFGQLPLRHDLSRPSGVDGFTDIMSIPPSVARRAYQAAARGEASEFFYVRRFVDPAGGPDEYVTVTCRLTDGGARTPFSVTDVDLAFATLDAVPAVRTGERVPQVTARVVFNGTGRLRGRWEIVRPGEEPPSAEDLLPEASLPLELRASQRRYMEVDRFDVLLPPVGDFVLEGPDPARLPTIAPGEYLLLLRIEATDDKEGDSDLAAAGAGSGLAHTGGVAGFAVPPLHYHVGADGGTGVSNAGFRALTPVPDAQLDPSARLSFSWIPHSGAQFHRLEIQGPDGTALLAAVLPAGLSGYDAPIWLRERLDGPSLRWRVVALGTAGRVIGSTDWRTANVAGAGTPDGTDDGAR
jgi:hypothetical protein